MKSQTRQLLKEYLSRKASFHVYSACVLRHFRDDKKIRDRSLVSEPPIQLAEGLSWQCMISSLRNDALWPCGEVQPLHLHYIITGSFVLDWPIGLFTVHLKYVASFSFAHPPTTSIQLLPKDQQQPGNRSINSGQQNIFNRKLQPSLIKQHSLMFTYAQLLVWIKITGFYSWWKLLLYDSDIVCLLLRVYTHFI